jgi:hypothetical protein
MRSGTFTSRIVSLSFILYSEVTELSTFGILFGCGCVLAVVGVLSATAPPNAPPEQMFGLYTASQRDAIINQMRATRSDPEQSADNLIEYCSDPKYAPLNQEAGMCPEHD